MGRRRRNCPRAPDKRNLGRQRLAISKPTDRNGSQRTASPASRSSPPSPQTTTRYVLPTVCGLLLLAVALPFLQTVGFEFLNFDDDQYVTDNPQVRGGLTGGGLGWALTHCCAANWHPLTMLSHMLDCQFYGLQPWGHHLTSVLLHAASAVLLLVVLRRLTGRFWPSALVAALFAAHPLRSESVAWVAERKDVLCGVLFFLTLAAYAWYVRRPGSWGRYALLVLTFALGLLAKPMLVTLPLVLLLLDFWPLRRWAAKPLGWEAGPENAATALHDPSPRSAGWRRGRGWWRRKCPCWPFLSPAAR